MLGPHLVVIMAITNLLSSCPAKLLRIWWMGLRSLMADVADGICGRNGCITVSMAGCLFGSIRVSLCMFFTALVDIHERNAVYSCVLTTRMHHACNATDWQIDARADLVWSEALIWQEVSTRHMSIMAGAISICDYISVATDFRHYFTSLLAFASFSASN